MGNQVIALEDKPHAMVAIRVPLRIPVSRRGHAIHNDLAGIGAVEASEDIEKSRFTGPRRAENGNEFAVPKRYGNPIQGLLDEVARVIRLADVADLNHVRTLL